MASALRQSPHSVKQWQLESFGLKGDTKVSVKDQFATEQPMCSQTRFSAWTPISSKSSNKQLFYERVNLIGHWFDLWTDKQRREFLYSILMKSSKSQLKFVRDWFAEEVPVTKLDFTTVLPRFISLYIFCFLNPHDLCTAAQVSWHWKFLTEQDCLWMPKCTKFGWFLPYTPSENEYGAWKSHYIKCACTLDYLTPREAAETYGTLNEPKEGIEEEEEKLKEKIFRKILREKLALHKKELVKTRSPWMSGAWKSAISNSRLTLNQSESRGLTNQAALQAALWLIKDQKSFSNKTTLSQLINKNDHTPSFSLALEKTLVENSLKSLPKRQHELTFSPTLSPHRHSVYQQYGFPNQLHLVLISSMMPAYEVVLDSVKSQVIPVVYDFCGMTPESLLFYVEKALSGCTAQSIGIVTDGDSQNIHLLQRMANIGCPLVVGLQFSASPGKCLKIADPQLADQGCQINMQNILSPEIRDFWEKLGSCVVPRKEGGHIDVFVPLAASESGMEILDTLSQMTGVTFSSPTGITTGSYLHILSEWLAEFGSSVHPPNFYFHEVKFQAWCRLADIMEEALHMVRKQMKQYLGDLKRNISGRLIGKFMSESMTVAKFQANHLVAMALTDGLVELSQSSYDDPLEFLSSYLIKKYGKTKEYNMALHPEVNSKDTLTSFLKVTSAISSLKVPIHYSLPGRLIHAIQSISRNRLSGSSMQPAYSHKDWFVTIHSIILCRSQRRSGKVVPLKIDQEDSNENVSPEITSPPLSENELRFQQLTFLVRMEENKLLTNKGDKRTRFAREIVRSEKQYVQTLEIIKKVYVVPLKAALSSNRAILSFSNVQIIFSDIMEIFKINKHFLKELTERLQEWGPSECLGDIFMKFGSQLHKYTNFFNNYSVILKTIDKCRESMPSFRAFLKRHDQTVLTKMMSIQEMMLLPSSRFEEYVNLLYAIRLHTSPDHSDRKDLSTAIGQMKHYKDYISQLKASLDKDEKMTRIQKSIQGCPNLVEDNRHLIRLQDVSLLTCPDEEISVPLRIYEHISDLSLFLFNDALVISSRHTSYAPFLRSPKTSYQFMASVSLPRLLVEDIPDSKYVQNAFVLRGPKRKWICSAVSEEEKFTWLSVSQSAICASIEKC